MFAFIIIPLVLSFLISSSPPISFESGSNENGKTLILTAHPDDECMFFAPTILSLTSQGQEVFGLALSNGNADGVGGTREVELRQSYGVLGVPHDKVWIINHPELQDNITQAWPAAVVADILGKYVWRLKITTILTFDNQGVSGHPNHISLYDGAQRFVSMAHKNNLNVTMYALHSVALTRKYNAIMAPLAARLVMQFEGLLRAAGLASSESTKTMVSNIAGFNTALTAMRKHQSQLVWFRWLYVSFSRYMWVNDWVQVNPIENKP